MKEKEGRRKEGGGGKGNKERGAGGTLLAWNSFQQTSELPLLLCVSFQLGCAGRGCGFGGALRCQGSARPWAGLNP